MSVVVHTTVHLLGHVHLQPTVILRVNVFRCLIYSGSRKSPVQSPVHAVGTKIPKLRKTSCTPRWHCERRFRLICCIHRARFVCFTNDGPKSNECHCKTTYLNVQDAQPTQYPLTTKWKWRIIQSCSKFQSQRVLIFRHVTYDTNGQNRGQALNIQWFHSNEILYGHPLASLLWERQFEGFSLGLGWEKVQN